MPDIVKNLAEIKREIALLAGECGHNPEKIRLVAVSKTFGSDLVRQAHHEGQVDFGENYAQEFLTKRRELEKLKIRWHFIGHLQGNKVKHVCGRDVLLHTLDRLSLAQTIHGFCEKHGFVQDVLIEVRLSPDSGKSGCPPEELNSLVKDVADFSSLNLKGLMTIGSQTRDRRVTEREFETLRVLRDEINRRGELKQPLTELSMGMSGDFQLAIRQGATILRVGTRIFGERN